MAPRNKDYKDDNTCSQPCRQFGIDVLFDMDARMIPYHELLRGLPRLAVEGRQPNLEQYGFYHVRVWFAKNQSYSTL